MLQIVVNQFTQPQQSVGSSAFSNPFYYHALKSMITNPLDCLASLWCDGTNKAMILSPVSLNTGHNDSIITAFADELALSSQQFEQMFRLIAQHFALDGIVCEQVDNYHAVLIAKELPLLELAPLVRVKHHSLMEQLSQDNISSIWLRYFTELQMLLSTASFKSQPQVNSIWVWGGSPPCFTKTTQCVVTDDQLIKRWCLQYSIDCYDSQAVINSDQAKEVLANKGKPFDLTKVSHFLIAKPSEQLLKKLRELTEKTGSCWTNNDNQIMIKKPTFLNRLIGLLKPNENNKKTV